MVVDCLSQWSEFLAIRARWLELYAADPHANFFLSWEWMHACFATDKKPWLVLGVRSDDGPYVAFLPLNCGRFPAVGPAIGRELSLAGIPRSDYTGMLALPGEEQRVIPALARCIERLSWDNFALNDCADERVALLAREIASSCCAIAHLEPSPCPFIDLPSTWEGYLAGRSVATRRTLRARMRKLEALPGYRFRTVPPQEAEEAVELLLRINSLRWGKSLDRRRRIFGEVFRRCYAAGRFVVKTLHVGTTLIAAQGSFIEPDSRTLLGYMMGYDSNFSHLSPGTVLVALSIREAIEQGFARYDLSRGGEPYKRSLCTGLRYTAHAKLTRRGLRVAAINVGRSGLSAAKGVARALLRRPA